MEDQQAATEPSQQFENIDFNSSPDDNNKDSSNNEDQEQVKYFKFFIAFFIAESMDRNSLKFSGS